MKPTEKLASATTPDGEELLLTRRDGVYLLAVDGLELMSSRSYGSEEAVARLACGGLGARRAPRVLVGGLGFGFTLRAALDLLPADATVVVAELFEAVIAWNRGELGELAGRPLEDSRARVVNTDVATRLAPARPYDAIILDVDNGPWAFTLRANERLYGDRGLRRLYRSLAPGGVLTVWSASPDPGFERRLRCAGFAARSERVAARGRGQRGRKDVIFVARRGTGERGLRR